ncbi:amidohydrolase family protein [Microbacterium aurantiacum]|uniref:amidohydrolase family protein n=1 Tax=Microbacterium aurantiacum TaxID=162393 RepID=UPI0034467B2A
MRIVDGTIAEVADALDADGCRVVDAGGLWVMPGFVDAHSHADAAALTGEGMQERALAGVTTEIVGQDGLGLPFSAGAAWPVMADTLPPIAGRLPGSAGYRDVAEYLAAVDRGAYARVATHVPHGTVRAAVLGSDLRAAAPDEMDAMRELLVRGVAQGAVGVSTGLSYAPALAADTSELIDVLRGLPTGTPYVTHLRDYAAGFAEAVDEAVSVCRSTGLSLHLSHFHVSGPGRAGTAGAYLPGLSDAEATWDTYPYTSGCTFLRSILPARAATLTAQELEASLSTAGFGAALAAEIDAAGPGPTVAGGWESIHLVGLGDSDAARWESRTVADIAADTGSGAGAIVVRALEATRGAACLIVDHGHLENVRALTGAEGHLVGSDGIMGSGQPHPRVTNAFFRFLAWARADAVPVSIEEMVARMTARTAARFRLPLGAIGMGLPADVLVMDPDAVEPGPEFGHRTPSAVVHSFIAGAPVVVDGRWRGDARRGLAVRASEKRK